MISLFAGFRLESAFLFCGSQYLMSLLTPGVWECKNCYTRNVRKLERCSRCDCVNPLILSPLQASSVRSATYAVLDASNSGPSVTSYGRDVDPTVRQLVPGSSPSPSRQRSQLSPGRTSPPRESAGLSAPPFRSVEVLFSPSPFQRRPSPPSSTASPSAAFASYTAQQNATLHSQLTQAIAAHRSLMHEYAELNTVCDRHEDTIDRLRRDLVALDSVYRAAKQDAEAARGSLDAEKSATLEDRKRLEQRCERLEREVEEREKLWRGKSSLIDSLQREKDASVLELRDAFAKERSEWSERIQGLEIDLRSLHAEYKAQQTQYLTQSAEQQRLFASEREQYTESSQKLLRELSSSHHSALSKMTEEVSNTKELSSLLAKKEREMLQERVDHEQTMRIDAERRRERDTSDTKLELERVRQSLETVTKQRDELLSEATFQLEIVSELRTEKAACKAELSALRIAASSVQQSASSAAAGPPISTILDGAIPNTLRAPQRSATTSPIPSLEMRADVEERRRLEQQVKELTDALEESYQHSATLEATLEQLRTEILDEKRSHQESLVALRSRNEQLEADVAKLRDELATQLSASSPASTTTAPDHETIAQYAQDVLRLERTIADLQRSMTTVQNDFADECADNEASKIHHEEQERALQQRLAATTRRVEELQNSLADQQAENTKLVEECEALRVAMSDMEQSYADALSVVAPQ